ncbi:hypothetical protein ES705_14798 [subsurface metagenome]
MRNKSLRVIVLFLILSLCFSSIVFAETKLTSSGNSFKWSLFTNFGPNEAAICYIWPRLFDEIREKTNGQLDISVFWEGQQPYTGGDLLKVVKDGTAELVHFGAGFLTSTEPVLGLFALPFIKPDTSMERFKAEAAMFGNFEQKDEFLENILEDKWGAQLIHGLPGCWIRIFTKGYKVDSINSLKGHKIRVFSPELAKFVSILGGTPVTIEYGEVYTALSTGLIDGAITTLQVAESAGWLDVLDTINIWNITAYMDATAVNTKALNKLPDDIKNIFLEVMRSSAQKPELAELQSEALLLERKITEGYTLYVPDEALKKVVREKIQEQVINPWIKDNGTVVEKAFDVLKKITEN